MKNMDVFTTFGNGRWNEQFHQRVQFVNGCGTENRVVNLYPEMTYETFEGFGGAITESAAYVYSLMSEEQKKTVMETYFAPDKMNYQNVRIPIDSCDFSLGQYEAMSDPEDLKLQTFSFGHVEKWIIPMLRDAERAAGKPLNIMLAPWSPPAFMKTNGMRSYGGALKPEYRKLWVEYLCRYIEEYQKRGFAVKRLTLQNEPKAVQTWDSCIFTAEEEKCFLRDFMYPAMERHGLTDIEIFLWDHNKERVYEWMRDIIDEETDKMIAGAAFHWYSGDHFEALDLCRERFPDKKLIVSESCIEFSKFGADDSIGAAMYLSHDLIGNLNHGMTAFNDWNLILDEEGGPNYVGNYCLAPFLFHTKEKKLYPQLIQQYLEHFSCFLTPGSVRIAHSRFSEMIEVTAWKRPDDTIAIVLLNKSEENQPICVRLNGHEAALVLFPKSITTGIID